MTVAELMEALDQVSPEIEIRVEMGEYDEAVQTTRLVHWRIGDAGDQDKRFFLIVTE